MANTFELEGSLKQINDLQTFSSGFSKREFVLEIPDGKYPQVIKFETVRDKTALLDGLNIGEQVKVTFDIRGNEYNGRYYVNLNAWKIEKAGAGASSPNPPSQTASEDPPSSAFDSSFDSEPEPEDDIPF